MESRKLELLKQIATGHCRAVRQPTARWWSTTCGASTRSTPSLPLRTATSPAARWGTAPRTWSWSRCGRRTSEPEDHLGYLTRTPDGKILKSSTMYIRNSKGKVTAILSINYDISSLLMVESAVQRADLPPRTSRSGRSRRRSSTSTTCWMISSRSRVALVGKAGGADEQGRQGEAPSGSSARTARSSSPSPATRSQNTSAYPNIRYILILTRTTGGEATMGKIDLTINKDRPGSTTFRRPRKTTSSSPPSPRCSILRPSPRRFRQS